MELLSASSDLAAVSPDFTVGAGKELVVYLKHATGGSLFGASVSVQRKDGAGIYTTVGRLNDHVQALVLRNPSAVDVVFRVERERSLQPVGVDAETAQYPIHTLPPALLTGTSKPRIRVDPGQTGFFEKREFRTFKELSISAGATYVVRATVPVNIILTGLELVVDDGKLRLESAVGGTPGGTFSEALPIIPRNAMTETPAAYTPQVALEAGGTHTGGTLLDVILLHTANATGSASSVGNAQQDERGVAPNTYYFRFTNTGSGTVAGVFRARWEERP